MSADQISHLILKHECIVFDACCLITIHTSGHMQQMLSTVSPRIVVPDYIFQQEISSFDAEEQRRKGVFVVEASNDNLYANMVKFAGYGLDNGESFVCALAEQNGWAIATDDRQARRICGTYLPHLQVIDTPTIINHWALQSKPTHDALHAALLAVQTKGKYRPRRAHPLTAWWLNAVNITSSLDA